MSNRTTDRPEAIQIGQHVAPLAFSPDRVAKVGGRQIDALFLAAMDTGGDRSRAIADLYEIATGGVIPAGAVMAAEPDADQALPPLYEAWLSAWRGAPRSGPRLPSLPEIFTRLFARKDIRK